MVPTTDTNEPPTGVSTMQIGTLYPTNEHKRASEAIVEFFQECEDVEAVLLTCSCARGKATRDSCLDMAVLVLPEILSMEKAALEHRWNDFYKTEEAFKTLAQVGRYSHVDVEFLDGCFVPHPRSWTSGPDEFELEIGNSLVYSVPLWNCGEYLEHLKAKWLPYYDETLRRKRLAMVRRYCLNNLDHIPLFIERGLHFQAFHRLYDAFREFLQALFISRRTYPIAYDKWVREQVEEILGLPELYRQLPKLFEIDHFESLEMGWKAKELERLLEEYVVE